MNKKYFNIALVLFSAWTVYGHCQNDMFLRNMASVFLLVSFLPRLKTTDRRFALFTHIPFYGVMIIAFIAGFFWQGLHPHPQDSVSPFPTITSSLQCAAIFASLIVWMKPFTMKNLYQLFFLACLSVAVSINVHFTNMMLVNFCAFCIIAVGFVILNTMNKPEARKHLFRHYRDFIIFTLVLVMSSTVLFYAISRTLIIFDQAFMNLVSDYVMPRDYTHFLRLDPFMKLGNPGRSARDKRPVLEIEIPDVDDLYLKTQIFDDFADGVWEEQTNTVFAPLPEELPKDQTRAKMTMFTSLGEIIPTPYHIGSARGNMPLEISPERIVYTPDDRRTKIVTFSQDPQTPPARISPAQYRQYTAIPDDIAFALKDISDKIIGPETNRDAQITLLRNYFLQNFRYSLDVDFKADNEGLISMLRERRPAYCTYFATALTMLLRSQDIPARVATGFLVDEKIDRKRNKLLARVFDAHAWVEVLDESRNPETGAWKRQWKIFDPTPGGQRTAALKQSFINFSGLAENMWLSTLRLIAFIENMDKEKLKKNMLFALILTLMFINRKNIIDKLRGWMARSAKNSPHQKDKRDPLLRIYRRYERYLKTVLDETRKTHDTDADVIRRLKQREHIPPETISKIESFISHYHAARFGSQKDLDLAAIISRIDGES